MFCCTIYNPLKYYQSPQNSLSKELELKGRLVQLVCVEKGQTIFQNMTPYNGGQLYRAIPFCWCSSA